MDTGVPAASAHYHRNIAIEPDANSGSEVYLAGKIFAAPPSDMALIAQDSLTALDHHVSAIHGLLGALNPALGLISAASSGMAHTYLDFCKTWWGAADPRNLDSEWLHSTLQAEQMIRLGANLPPDAPQVEKRLNRKFFTHNEDGTLNEADPAVVQQLFTGKQETWPNLVLTSSHALVRGHADVSGIMQGMHAFITHVFADEHGQRGQDLPLLRHLDTPPAPSETEGRHTVILSSVFNYRNGLDNGGHLLYRLDHLDKLYSNPPQTQAALEKAYIGDEQAHDSMSPAAVRLGKLMLSLIVEDPQHIDLGARTLTEPKEPIALREDAGAVLQHIKLAGYSKGGNTVTDAVRYLILELQHKDPQGQASFLVPQHYDPAANPTGGPYAPVTDKAIRNLIHNVGILCVNPGVTPLTDRERGLGMRRITIRNKLDRITAHLFKKHDREGTFGEHDDVYVVSGKSFGDLGHSPEAALGSKEKPGYLSNLSLAQPEDTGTLEEIKGRLRSFFAHCYGKVGISHLHYKPQSGTRQELNLEFSTGVSNEDVFGNGHAPKINLIRTAMEQAGFTQVMLEHDPDDLSRCRISFTPPPLEDVTAKLREAFGSLNRTEEIFVSPTTLKYLTPSRQVTGGERTDTARLHAPTTGRAPSAA